MMTIAPPLRPARTAIAAVLVLASTPLLAQTVPPPSEPAAPDTPPPVVATVPAAPPAAAPAPVATAPVAAAPATAPTVVPTVTSSAPASEEAAAPVTRTARSAPAASAVRSAPSSAATSRTPVDSPASPLDTAPAAPLLTAPATSAATNPASADAQVASVEPVAQASAADDTDTGTTAVLVGGIVLLAGAGAVYALRRRKSEPEHAPAQAAPIIDPDRVSRIDAPVEPPRAAPAAERSREIVGSQDRFAFNTAAPAVIAPAPDVPVQTEKPTESVLSTTAERSVDDMIAAPPSRANPFLTRKNRLRRAHFLLRQENHDDRGNRAEVTDAAAAPARDRAEVYHYGGKGGASRLGRPKPVFQ